MKFLIDGSPAKVDKRRAAHPQLVLGQLRTPLTSNKPWEGPHAIDNGAFKGFNPKAFTALLKRQEDSGSCLFVVAPDMPGSAQRTMELFDRRHEWLSECSSPVALVAQDGSEDVELPWAEFDCLFLGGMDPWKDSMAAMDVVRTARLLGKHVHIGRVNTPRRFKRYKEVADTCDGSGVSIYDWMLDYIASADREGYPLFDGHDWS